MIHYKKISKLLNLVIRSPEDHFLKIREIKEDHTVDDLLQILVKINGTKVTNSYISGIYFGILLSKVSSHAHFKTLLEDLEKKKLESEKKQLDQWIEKPAGEALQ